MEGRSTIKLYGVVRCPTYAKVLKELREGIEPSSSGMALLAGIEPAYPWGNQSMLTTTSQEKWTFYH